MEAPQPRKPINLETVLRVLGRQGKWGGRKGRDPQGEPVGPQKLNLLSGGAAATPEGS